ncbi:MAG: hypothetical protein LBI33_14020 [Propionibacteriaceae bacterium]|nr:hypothetical protein [Propionibacteriaceae bacterium]
MTLLDDLSDGAENRLLSARGFTALDDPVVAEASQAIDPGTGLMTFNFHRGHPITVEEVAAAIDEDT